MKALPDDLQAIVEQIDAADLAAESLSASLTDEQFHWQPDGGRKWSVAQCLEHLALNNVLYSAAVREGVAAARAKGWTRQGPLAPGLFGRWFVRGLEPPVRMRARTRGSVRPGSGLTREQILLRYHDAHQGVRALVQECAEIDTNRATYKNPFLRFVWMKVSTGLQAITAHDRRHLWQAEEVTRRPDFPPATPGRTG